MLEDVRSELLHVTTSQFVVRLVDIEVDVEPVSLLDQKTNPEGNGFNIKSAIMFPPYQVGPFFFSHGNDEPGGKLIQNIQGNGVISKLLGWNGHFLLADFLEFNNPQPGDRTHWNGLTD